MKKNIISPTLIGTSLFCLSLFAEIDHKKEKEKEKPPAAAKKVEKVEAHSKEKEKKEEKGKTIEHPQAKIKAKEEKGKEKAKEDKHAAHEAKHEAKHEEKHPAVSAPNPYQLSAQDRQILTQNLKKTRSDIQRLQQDEAKDPSNEEIKNQLHQAKTKEHSILQRLGMSDGKVQPKSSKSSIPAHHEEAPTIKKETVESSPFIKTSGTIELQYLKNKSFVGTQANNLIVRTAQLAFNKEIMDLIHAEMSFLYEEGMTPLELEKASLSFLFLPELTLKLGRDYLRFGQYKSEFASLPLTSQMGLMLETSANLSSHFEFLDFGFYVFKGNANKNNARDRISSFGAFIDTHYKSDVFGFDLGFAYTNNFANSQIIEPLFTKSGFAKTTPAQIWNLDFMLFDHLFLYNEYLIAQRFSANDITFKNRGAKMQSYKFELAYHFSITDLNFGAQLGYQNTQEAKALNLPKSRWLLGASYFVMEGLKTSFEFLFNQDYGTGECSINGCGTGKSGNTFLLSAKYDF